MFYKFTPYTVFKRLWGDRKNITSLNKYHDQDYINWQKLVIHFYENTQRDRLGTFITNFGYKIVDSLTLQNKKVLEIGPGQIRHIRYFKSKPEEYHIADIRPDFLSQSEKILLDFGIHEVHKHIIDGINLPMEDASFDIIFSFNQLEHVENLEDFLLEIRRVLKPRGLLVGSVPTEGGLLWGAGRYLTTRRFVKQKYNINYDKIICWEHPNFVDKVQLLLKKYFKVSKEKFSPLILPLNDLNLIYTFVYERAD